MKKFCIFCGEEPESKNREHVIPQWLIRMTGAANRETHLGLKWRTLDLEKRQFSLSSFTFPACEACNTECADLEARTKSIVEDIIECKALGADHWDTFLDWLDKVRIGLWLGMIYLNENHRGLNPQFHINRRIGSKDRFLIIYQIEDDGIKGVGWAATESPLFQNTPSCFTLTINNFLFFNASYDFLLSHKLGFPFPLARRYRPDGGEWMDMTGGTEKVLLPLSKKRFKTGGTQLFQPMIPYDHFRSDDGSIVDCSELYDNEYVRANCMDYVAGRGVIFRRQRNTLVAYSAEPSKEWIPNQRFPRGEVHHQTGVLAGEFLEEICKNYPSFDDLSDKERCEREAEVAAALRLHKTMMVHYIAQRKMFY